MATRLDYSVDIHTLVGCRSFTGSVAVLVTGPLRLHSGCRAASGVFDLNIKSNPSSEVDEPDVHGLRTLRP